MPLTKDRPPNSVIVELVIDRSFKDDCRAHTGTIWRGKGDQNYYPAHLWPQLAPHPDVWKLIGEAEVARPADITPAAAIKLEEEAAAKLDAQRAEARRIEEEDAQRQAEARANQDQHRAAQPREDAPVVTEGGDITENATALQEKTDVAAGEGTDLVHVQPEDVSFADSFDYAGLDQAKQDAMSVPELRELAEKLDFGLHPRLGEGKLRPRFAELVQQRLEQLHEESDTTDPDAADLVPNKTKRVG